MSRGGTGVLGNGSAPGPSAPGPSAPGPSVSGRTTSGKGVVERGADELAPRLRIAVTRLNRRLRQESVTGVSPSQESALATIKRLGRPTLGELAQAEQVQPPTMTRVVAGMEASGLLVRLGDEGDRRVSRVELSPAGREELERIKSLKNAYLAQQIERLSTEERAIAAELVGLLERLVEEP